MNQYMSVQGFPWNVSLKKCESSFGGLKIALVHEYRWVKEHKYPTAQKEAQLKPRAHQVDKNGKWLGWDVVIYGDNHKGFLHRIENTVVFNTPSWRW